MIRDALLESRNAVVTQLIVGELDRRTPGKDKATFTHI
jgi:hypothetical protein